MLSIGCPGPIAEGHPPNADVGERTAGGVGKRAQEPPGLQVEGEDPVIHNQVGFQSSPAVVNGVVYTGCRDSNLYAIDAATGNEIWHYFYQNPREIGIIYSPWNRGVAVNGGRVFFGTLDNSVVALDQKTGEEVWRVNIEDSRQCGCNDRCAISAERFGSSRGDGRRLRAPQRYSVGNKLAVRGVFS